MVGDEYRADVSLRWQLNELNVTVRPVAPLPRIRCTGRVRSGAGFGSFSSASYAKLTVWNLTEFDAVLYLDTDLLVRTNLDHVRGHHTAAESESSPALRGHVRPCFSLARPRC